MIRIFILVILWLNFSLWAQNEVRQSYQSYSYEVARTHEIKPHRRTIPIEGVRSGLNQIRLTLTVSPKGDVVDAKAEGDSEILKLWPQLEAEVRHWKFIPFEEHGKAVTAEVEEYIDLVPPERLPKTLIPAPAIGPDSKVVMTLGRGGCFGTCPGYTVTVSTDGIIFEGRIFVVARGRHTQTADANQVRTLAKRFIAAEFYSMEDSYKASVSDCPTYVLSIEIAGHKKEVIDYEGQWVGMPAVIVELEDEIDTFAGTQKWIDGDDGLMKALWSEKFNFQTYEAQVMLKEVASRGKAAIVKELLSAGVPLKSLPPPKSKDPYVRPLFEHVGWLNAAKGNLETLKVLIDAGASRNDQADKDLGLVGAALSGNVEAARALIAYGANPKSDLSKLIITEGDGFITSYGPGTGNILIYAAKSGNPEMVRDILRFHPNLEARDHAGQTAIFAAVNWNYKDKEGDRVKCLRLLTQAGAKVNVQDNDGNTPLHETFLTDVIEELLKLGANVNAKNKNGETPIFTTADDDAIPLFIKYGADLSIRNKNGQTVLEAAEEEGAQRQKILQEAIEKSKKHR